MNVKTEEEEEENLILYLTACMIFLFLPLSCFHLCIILTGPDVTISAE